MCAVAHEQADDNADAVLLDSYDFLYLFWCRGLPGEKGIPCESGALGRRCKRGRSPRKSTVPQGTGRGGGGTIRESEDLPELYHQ